MTNKEKFLTLVSEHDSTALAEMKWRIDNRPWLKHSQSVAIRILTTLRTEGISQKELAGRLNVTPQQVSKWVKGRENFTLETISKIEAALNIELLSIPEFKVKTVTPVEASTSRPSRKIPKVKKETT